MEHTKLGGNSILMESRLVRDYERASKEFVLKMNNKPDIIVVPDYFANAWGSDFTSESIYQIQYKTGIPVERIPWHLIYGKED
jgi:hypothetical protein